MTTTSRTIIVNLDDSREEIYAQVAEMLSDMGTVIAHQFTGEKSFSVWVNILTRLGAGIGTYKLNVVWGTYLSSGFSAMSINGDPGAGNGLTAHTTIGGTMDLYATFSGGEFLIIWSNNHISTNQFASATPVFNTAGTLKLMVYSGPSEIDRYVTCTKLVLE